MIPVLVSQEKTAPVPAPVPITVQEEEPSGETDTPTSVAPPPEPSPVKAAPTGTDMVAEKTEGLFIVINQQTMFDFVCGGRGGYMVYVRKHPVACLVKQLVISNRGCAG